MNSNEPRSIPKTAFILIMALTLIGGCGSEAAWDGNSVMLRYGNVTVEFSGKTYDRAEGEDWVPPEIAKGVARAIVANLDKAG